MTRSIADMEAAFDRLSSLRPELPRLPGRPAATCERRAAAAPSPGQCHVTGCTVDHYSHLRPDTRPVIRDAAWQARRERRMAMTAGQWERLDTSGPAAAIAIRCPEE